MTDGLKTLPDSSGDNPEKRGGRERWIEPFKKIEVTGLYCLGFFLALAESPMHIGFVLFFVGALGRRVAGGEKFWRAPDQFEYLLLTMAGIALLSTWVNWPLVFGLRGPRVALTLLALFWIMYRNVFTGQQIKRFLYLLVGAVVAGLLWGLWRWWAGLLPTLELPSAGVVTQASIFLGVVIFVMFGIVLDTVSGFSKKTQMIVASCLVFSWICLILMGSRGGLLGAVVGSLPLVALFFKNKRFRNTLGVMVMLGVILIAGAHFAGKGFFWEDRLKHLSSISMGKDESRSLSPQELEKAGDLLRMENWKIGYAQIFQGGHFWLGVGPRNYSSVKVNSLHFDQPLLTYPAVRTKVEHAHNLFLTKWVEEGLLGLIVFVAFLFSIAWNLMRNHPRQGNIHWFWVACLGALIVPTVAGSFNSPYYNEFAWLAMMIMGYYMGRMRVGLERKLRSPTSWKAR